MIKLYEGELKGQSFDLLGCGAAYNWQHYDRLGALGARGVVWPMLRRADQGRHLARLEAWRKVGYPITHAMVLNEPFNAGQDGPLSPDAAARWAREAIAGAGLGEEVTLLLGGLLLEYPATYHELRGRARDFAQAFGAAENVVWAFHLYFPEVPGNVAAALSWYKDQVEMIANDFPRFAITETGVLRTGYSQRERDMAILEELLRGTWAAADARQCYAYGWYLSAPNALTGMADYVLCDYGGRPRRLGQAYRELVATSYEELAGTSLQEMVDELALAMGYLAGYLRDHPGEMSREQVIAQIQAAFRDAQEAWSWR